MPKQTKTCRVCGAKYEACRSIKNGDGVFNWREVACSPECGAVYLQRVMASRKNADSVVLRKKKRVHSDGTSNNVVRQPDMSSMDGDTIPAVGE